MRFSALFLATAAGSVLASGLLPDSAGARLTVHPTSYSVQVDQGSVTTEPLHIRNEGPASPLGYTVYDNRDWLSEYPTSGEIIAGQEVEVTVTIDATGLAPGDYSGTITVVDPHHGPTNIPFALTVNAVVGIGSDRVGASASMILGQNIPNPMSSETEIYVRLQNGGLIRLDLLDLRGREVRVLYAGLAPAGETRIRWNGTDREGRSLPSGIYFYRLDTRYGTLVRRLSILR